MDQLINEVGPENLILRPHIGYKLAASAYENWHWFQFWRHNEMHIVEHWARTLSPGTFLDAGSGTGLYRPLLEDLGHKVIAADQSAEMLKIQLQKNPTSLIVQATLDALPFLKSSFNYLLCTRVLSHIDCIEPIFKEFARVTKSDASLLVTDVHPEHRYSEMSIPTATDRISIQTHKHSIKEIKRTLEISGFELSELREFLLQDLKWKPPNKGFENIYDAPARPIFYVCSFRRM